MFLFLLSLLRVVSCALLFVSVTFSSYLFSNKVYFMLSNNYLSYVGSWFVNYVYKLLKVKQDSCRSSRNISYRVSV